MTRSGQVLRILGFDPGSLATGWGLIESSGSDLRGLEWGVVDLGKGRPLARRLLVLHEEVSALLMRTRPDEVAVEEVYVARNARSALVLGHARGVVLLACAQAGRQPAEYAANVIKQSVLGQGGRAATKERIAFMVRAVLGLNTPPGNADATDALACAICHAHRRNVVR